MHVFNIYGSCRVLSSNIITKQMYQLQEQQKQTFKYLQNI